MLVPGFPGEGEAPETLLRLPGVDEVDAWPVEAKGMFLVKFEPKFSRWQNMRERLPRLPERIDPDRHLPMMVERVRQEMRLELGAQVDSLSRPAGIDDLLAESRELMISLSPLLAVHRIDYRID